MSKKNEEVQVDEDMIRSIMMKEVPVYQGGDFASSSATDDYPAPIFSPDESTPKPEVVKGAGRRKKKVQDNFRD